MAATAIEWTDVSWNPVTGCDRVSPGCAHCYALELAARLKAMGQERYSRDGDPKTSGPGFGLTLHWDKIQEPRRWRKPRMVFVNSMSDLFHPEIPSEFIGRVFEEMRLAQQHTFQVLTKRPERMRDWITACARVRYWPEEEIVPPNVWLGTSIENRRFIDRAHVLRETPTAGVRFISAEPLLGSLTRDDLGDWTDDLTLDSIDWLIVGGESGPKARRIDPEWVRDLRDATRYYEDEDLPAVDGPGHTAFFFKQWGGRTPKAGGRELDGRTWDEFPTTSTREVAAA